jgi:hypothetical protein
MCHHRRQTFTQSSVRGAAHDDDAAMRASDADRERVVEALRKHAAAGRLSVGELEDRSASAYGARTLAALAPLVADLPEATPLGWGRGLPVRPRAARQLALLATVLIAIWAATGFGYFWPLWPILGTLWFARSSAFGRRSFCARGHRGLDEARVVGGPGAL